MSQINSELSDPWLMSEDKLIISSIDLKFGDNFEPKCIENDINSKQINLDFTKQLDLLPDSQQYIQSLERKLDKLKGKTKDVSAKDVINSLSAKRDALFQQFLESNVGHEYDFDVETHDSNISNNSSVYSLVERRLFPQSQAITAEELQRLLEADILEKINSNNRSDK